MKAQITYHEENGYLYPDLALPEQTHYPIGKYGDLHLAYLKEHKRATYITLMTTGKLNEQLHKVDEQAHEMLNSIIARLTSERGVNEALKAENALLWVQEMNNCKASAEKIVLQQIVFWGSLNIQCMPSGEKNFRQSKQKFARIMAISAKNFCNE